MSAIKNNLDRFPDTQAFDQGESFGRHVARQELLPLLKKALHAAVPVERHESASDMLIRLCNIGFIIRAAIADIERPPVTPKPTTPTDDESIPF